ncbi:hypothetical protein CUT44_23175 [Streptomyces carminius]|uniref:ESX-1 secretion-associated protein n=1 Tax=Streptomyces carminius TaxID=2665496 RepID=A0A2M8LU82_9ACTN|nr:hypothetical protein [Streptomyces carminius]PJE95504.1 hypothetical protein CUT44_23175 [Streptomyces carminius]
MSEFSADVEEVLASSRELRQLIHLGKGMIQRFEDGTSYYEGCWGVEGDDEFANNVVPQVRLTKEALGRAVGTVDQVADGVVETLAAEANAIRRPQDDALEDINRQGDGDDGDVRR